MQTYGKEIPKMSSSKLAVGIVGLPNVGKSTLFNALLKKQQAYAANFPFATIEPNIGVVPVPDARLKKLAEVVRESENLMSLPPQVPATVEFVDIAGLIAGAHKGEGLGNKFLSHIRETDAICHVVRNFSDPDIVREGSIDAKNDFEVIKMELILADLQTIEKQREPRSNATKDEIKRWELIKKLRAGFEKGQAAIELQLDEEETREARMLGLLTIKPFLVVINIGENEVGKASEIEEKMSVEIALPKEQIVAICAKLEEQIAALDEEEQAIYLNELGIDKSGLEKLITKAFTTLGLVTFLTAGEKETRAWTIKKDMRAQDAAGAIHNDFVKNFIKADVVSFDDFVNPGGGGWKKARENGKVRSEGRDYIVRDGDVIEFKIGI